MKINKLYLILIIILLNLSNTYSQCVPDLTYTDDSVLLQYSTNDIGGAAVNFKKSVVGSNINVIIDWSTLAIYDNVLLSEKIVKMNLQNLIIRNLAKDYFDANPGQFFVDINTYFEKNCGANIQILYELDQDAQLACCNQLEFNSSIIENFNTGTEIKKTFKMKKRIKCGTKCCIKTFTVQKQWNAIYNRYDYNLGTPVVSTYSDCTNTPIFLDCTTQLPVPCTGYCD
jgi:hypothetical protein